MAKLKVITKPSGGSPDSRHYKNNDTGNTFKAKHVLDYNIAGQPVLIVTVTQTDANGQAVIDPELAAPLITSHSHTFTDAELSDPNFDAAARLDAIMSSAIDVKEVAI